MIKLKQMLEGNPNVPASSAEPETAPTPAAAPGTGFQSHTVKKLSNEEKKKLLELVSKFNEYRSAMKMADGLKQVAENIVYIAEKTELYGMNETQEWFEGVGLERDMKELKKNAAELQKITSKIYPQVQLAESLYEEIGLKLERYFEL